MFTIFIFIGVLGLLVVVHEMGHFIVAKWSGVKVLEFGVGYPPRLFGLTWRSTTYTLNILPLGGFVRLAGEEDPDEQGSLASRSALVRLAVLSAGAGMNVLLPLVLFTIFFMIPQQVPITDVVIVGIAPDSPAQEAQIVPGDVVVEVHGREIRNSDDLRVAIQLRLGADSRWVLRRGNRLTEINLTPRVNPPEGQGSAGILLADARVSVTNVRQASTASVAGLRPDDLFISIGTARILFATAPQQALELALETEPGSPIPVQILRDGALVKLTLPASAASLDGLLVSVRPEVSESKPIWQAIPASFTQTRDILILFRNEVSRWFSGARPDVAGPIGIAQITGDIARSGISPLLFWTALLSINLAIVNLLPIPALDGGRITFVLLELARRGRRVSPEKERIVHLVGWALLITMLIAVSVSDIQRIVGDRFVGP